MVIADVLCIRDVALLRWRNIFIIAVLRNTGLGCASCGVLLHLDHSIPSFPSLALLFWMRPLSTNRTLRWVSIVLPRFDE